MTSLEKDFRDACRSLSNKVASSASTLKRSATVASVPTRKSVQAKPNHQRRPPSLMALIPPTVVHQPQTSTPGDAKAHNSGIASLRDSDASIHESSNFTIDSINLVHGSKFVELKRKEGKLEIAEMAKPTPKELELYRELETTRKALKSAQTALFEKENAPNDIPVTDAIYSSKALAVQYPARSDSQAWKLNIAKLKIFSVYASRPTIAAQQKTLQKLNEAGVFLVLHEEFDEDFKVLGIEETYYN